MNTIRFKARAILLTTTLLVGFGARAVIHLVADSELPIVIIFFIAPLLAAVIYNEPQARKYLPIIDRSDVLFTIKTNLVFLGVGFLATYFVAYYKNYGSFLAFFATSAFTIVVLYVIYLISVSMIKSKDE